MKATLFEILEITLAAGGERAARFKPALANQPKAGQYLLAHHPADTAEAVARTLFPTGLPSGEAFYSPLPPPWVPGDPIYLRGPLGKGFRLPHQVRRLALAAAGDSVQRLLPVVGMAAAAEVAVFTDAPLPRLPSLYEAYPLAALADNLSWPDFMAVDVPLTQVNGLPATLGLEPGQAPPCPTQVLVQAPMPCGGLAQCGICAVDTGRGEWKLVCEDGPVLPWETLFSPQSR